MEYLSIVPATAVGYFTFRAATHPASKFRKKMPNIIIKKRLHVFPTLRVYMFGRVFHFHHWVNLSILLIASLFVTGGVLGDLFTKGVLLGGILQGLRLPRGHRAPIYRDFSLERLTATSPKSQKN